MEGSSTALSLLCPQGSWNAKTNQSRFLPFMVTQHGGNCYQECPPDSRGHKTGARAPALLEGTRENPGTEPKFERGPEG